MITEVWLILTMLLKWMLRIYGATAILWIVLNAFFDASLSIEQLLQAWAAIYVLLLLGTILIMAGPRSVDDFVKLVFIIPIFGVIITLAVGFVVVDVAALAFIWHRALAALGYQLSWWTVWAACLIVCLAGLEIYLRRKELMF